jgi:parallel beta-helix repeat protein
MTGAFRAAMALLVLGFAALPATVNTAQGVGRAAATRGPEVVHVAPPTGEKEIDRASIVHAFWALHLGCCYDERAAYDFPDGTSHEFPLVRPTEGGHLVESNTFRSNSSGVRVNGGWTEAAIVRGNRFIDNWHAVSINGHTAHVLDNHFSVPQPERVPHHGFAWDAIKIAPPMPIHGETGPPACIGNVIAGNAPTFVEANIIEGNRILGAEGIGIEILRASRNRIVNNTIERIAAREPFPGNTAAGAPEAWRHANGSGIWISPGSDGNEIGGNTFVDIAEQAIVLEGDSNLVTRRAADPVRDLGTGNQVTMPSNADEIAALTARYVEFLNDEWSGGASTLFAPDARLALGDGVILDGYDAIVRDFFRPAVARIRGLVPTSSEVIEREQRVTVVTTYSGRFAPAPDTVQGSFSNSWARQPDGSWLIVAATFDLPGWQDDGGAAPGIRSGFFESDGVRLHYLDSGGDGVPLLFMPVRDRTAYSFIEFAERFTARHRVLAITSRGTGQSGGELEDVFSVTNAARDAVALLDALRIERAVVVPAWSADIAITLGNLHPHRLAGLIFLGGPPTPDLFELWDADSTGMLTMAPRLYFSVDGLDPDEGMRQLRARQEEGARHRRLDAPIRVPALAFVGAMGTAEVEDRWETELGLARWVAAEPGMFGDQVSREFYLQLASDERLQESVRLLYQDFVAPRYRAVEHAFASVFGPCLRLAPVEARDIGYAYRDAPDLIYPHIRRFLDDVSDSERCDVSTGADTVHVVPPTGWSEVDRASILAALGQVRPGGTIQFAPGTYLVGTMIEVTVPRVTLLGHPAGTTLRGYDPVVGVPLVLAHGRGGGELRDNLIEGNHIIGADGIGIEIRQASSNRIVNNTISGVVRRNPFPGNTLVSPDPQAWRDANGSGIWVSPGSDENEITGNTFEDIAAHAVVVEGSGNVLELRSAGHAVRDLGTGNRGTGPGRPDDTAQEGSRLIDLDGHAVHVFTAGWQHIGSGRPVIVFEAGAIQAWGGLPARLADEAAVVAYDRAGIGRSEWDDRNPTPEHVVQRLHRLLAALDAPPPYLLVGQSIGGPLVLSFARRYPDAVAGLVLVDPTPPMAEWLGSFDDIGVGRTGHAEFLAMGERYAAMLPPAAQAEMQHLTVNMGDFAGLDAARPGLQPAIPVAVLLAGAGYEIPPELPTIFDLDRQHQALLRRQVALYTAWTRTLPDATVTVANNSRHCIQCWDPDLVHATIRRVLYPDIRVRLRQAMAISGLAAASEEYQRLRSFYPIERFDEDLLDRLGHEYLGQGDVAAAITVFELNARAYAGAPQPHASLADAYLQAGRLDAAYASLERAVQLADAAGDPRAAAFRARLERVQNARQQPDVVHADFVETRGIRLHYLDFGGAGLPLIFVHDWYEDAHTWTTMAPAYADAYRVLAMTRRGYGESDDVGWGYDVATQSEDILGFMDALGIERAVIVGRHPTTQDMTWIAEHHPERLAGLVYLYHAVWPSPGDARMLRDRAFAEMFMRYGGCWMGDEAYARGAPRLLYRPHYADDERRRIDVPALSFTHPQDVGAGAGELDFLDLTLAGATSADPGGGFCDAQDIAGPVAYLTALAHDAERLGAVRLLVPTRDERRRYAAAFERAFASNLRTVRLEGAVDYRDDPEPLQRHMRAFLEEVSARERALQRPPAGSLATTADPVDAFIHERMASLGIPGVSLAVLRGTEVIRQAAYGRSSLELDLPMSPSAVFPYASMTKVVAATAILRLVEGGRLSLNDRIGDLIPELPEAWSGVPVRRLLDQTSGLPDVARPEVDVLPYTIREWVLAPTQDSAMAVLSTMPLQFRPGESSAYNQTNSLLLAMLLQRIDGRTLEDYVREEFAIPLGLSSFVYGDSRVVVPGRASWYTRFDYSSGRPVPGEVRPVWLEYPTFLHAGAGLNGSAVDLGRFIAAVASGELVGESARREMWMAGSLNDGSPARLGPFSWALGWLVDDRSAPPSITMMGAGSSAFRHYVDDDLTVIVLTNLQGADPWALVEGVANVFLRSQQSTR